MTGAPLRSQRYYEDYRTGEIVRSAGVTVTEAEVIDFAFRYDPQPFHMDKVAAAGSIYGGLIASGWQVGALGFRMLAQAGMQGEGSMGSPGLDEVRWHQPVRPGDTLYGECEVLEMRPSASKPDLGVVTLAVRIRNQQDAVVMSWQCIQLARRRPALP